VSKRVTLPTVRGATPLIFAILCEQTEIVRYFVETKKARLDVAVDGMRPIHYACLVGIAEIVQMILTAAPDEKSARNSMGYYPLHIAASNEHLQVVLVLIKAGAEVRVPNSEPKDQREIVHPAMYNMNLPLHCAMRNRDIKVARALIAGDSSEPRETVITRNRQGLVPLDVAEAFRNTKMAEFMKELMKGNISVPIFELAYMEYVEKGDEDKEEVNREVIEMLCHRVQEIVPDYVSEGTE
jgi:ankyrin repeat protein